jgi:hypothetical protein
MQDHGEAKIRFQNHAIPLGLCERLILISTWLCISCPRMREFLSIIAIAALMFLFPQDESRCSLPSATVVRRAALVPKIRIH